MDPVFRYHIYVILSAVILADKRIQDVELEAFVALVTGFQVALNDPEPETKPEIRIWFNDNHAQIFNWLHTPLWQENLMTHLEALSDFDFKWQLLQAMKSVALSDKEYHLDEARILRFAIDYWDGDFRMEV